MLSVAPPVGCAIGGPPVACAVCHAACCPHRLLPMPSHTTCQVHRQLHHSSPALSPTLPVAPSVAPPVAPPVACVVCHAAHSVMNRDLCNDVKLEFGTSERDPGLQNEVKLALRVTD